MKKRIAVVMAAFLTLISFAGMSFSQTPGAPLQEPAKAAEVSPKETKSVKQPKVKKPKKSKTKTNKKPQK